MFNQGGYSVQKILQESATNMGSKINLLEYEWLLNAKFGIWMGQFFKSVPNLCQNFGKVWWFCSKFDLVPYTVNISWDGADSFANHLKKKSGKINPLASSYQSCNHNQDCQLFELRSFQVGMVDLILFLIQSIFHGANSFANHHKKKSGKQTFSQFLPNPQSQSRLLILSFEVFKLVWLIWFCSLYNQYFMGQTALQIISRRNLVK